MDHLFDFGFVLVLFGFVLVMLSCASVYKCLISWVSFVMANFSIGILGQVCCFNVSISDLCPPPYFDMGAYLSLSKEQH